MEIFLVRIFPYLDWIRRFSPNTGKYGPEKTPYLNTFHKVYANAVYKFFKERAIKNRLNMDFLGAAAKHKVLIDEPGYSFARVTKGKKFIVGTN